MHRARMFYLRLVHYSHLSLSIPQSWRESCTEFLASRSQKKLKNYAPMGICVDCETEASRCIAEYPSNINQQRSTKRMGVSMRSSKSTSKYTMCLNVPDLVASSRNFNCESQAAWSETSASCMQGQDVDASRNQNGSDSV